MLRRLLLFLLLQPVFLLGTIRPARPRARHDRRAFIARAVGALGSLALRSADADDLPAGEAAATLPSGPEDKTIAEIPASGIVFKDIVSTLPHCRTSCRHPSASDVVCVLDPQRLTV